MSQQQENDGGWASRKLVLVSGSIVLLSGIAALSARYEAIQAVYTTLCSTVTVLVGLYCGANTLTRHVNNLADKDSPETQDDKPLT